ncbi:S8 family serine peptidase, partial [Gordonia sp. (in: high G+C Gram-positive bacteria)]|uniref:S8 family serine peptidase n=1 Tax=Gordonia sp. (in: high G+C Gram-positive bacteria) TaxID=84139 RepID=UPI0039E70612
LGAALRHALARDVVVVVAAGNVSSGGGCREQNPPVARGRGWSQAHTVATPAWFSDYVLTVGSVDSSSGAPSSFSLAGPWVGVAAPGTDLTSVDSRPGRRGLVSGLSGDRGSAPISGTSFAAAYVSATAALIRARHPDLDARAVMRRITSTAVGGGDGPDQRIGYGVVDPLAALTVDSRDSSAPRAMRVHPVATTPPPSRAPLVVALGGTALLLMALAITVGCARPRREEPYVDSL